MVSNEYAIDFRIEVIGLMKFVIEWYGKMILKSGLLFDFFFLNFNRTHKALSIELHY